MAVVSVDLTWSGESSNWNRSLEANSKGKAKFVEKYSVTVDDPANDDSGTVIQNGGVPDLGDQHDTYSAMFVDDVSVTRLSPVLFEATVSYSSFPFESQDPNNDPTAEPAIVEWDTVKTEGEIDEDADGNAIVTPNLEPVTGIKRPFSDLAATITRTFSSFNPVTFYAFIDHTNTGTFLGFAAGVGKVDSIKASPIQLTINDVAVTYYKVTAKVLFRFPLRTTGAKAWYNRRQQKGFLIKNAANDIVHATDAGGEHVTQPVLIANDGTQVTDVADAVWAEDKILGSADFSAMGFGV